MEGIPPRLLGAIRSEVQRASEEQLNDLWMVVHSLKDGMGPSSSGGDSELAPKLDELQARIETLSEQVAQPPAIPEEILEALHNIPEQSQVEALESRCKELEQQLTKVDSKNDSAELEQRLETRLKELESNQKALQKSADQLSETERRTAERLALVESRPSSPDGVDPAALKELEARLERKLADIRIPASAGAAAVTVSRPGDEGITDEELDALPTELGYELVDLLGVVINNSASGLHIKGDSRPMARLNGDLVPIGKSPLSETDCRALILKALPLSKRRDLARGQAVEHGISAGGAHFRMSAYWERCGLSTSCRRLTTEIPTPESLGLPEVLERLALRDRGLFLITGAAGSGLSTTIASLVEHINRVRKFHIVCLEERLEYFHRDHRSFVSQREAGSDFANLADAVRHAARQAPDVLAIGTLRSAEEIAAALNAAASGHLVIAGFHAADVTDALESLLERCSHDSERGGQEKLITHLLAISAQRLTSVGPQQPRYPLTEVMVNNTSIRNCLRKGSLDGVVRIMEQGDLGMHTFSQCRAQLTGDYPERIAMAESGEPAVKEPVPPSVELPAVPPNRPVTQAAPVPAAAPPPPTTVAPAPVPPAPQAAPAPVPPPPAPAPPAPAPVPPPPAPVPPPPAEPAPQGSGETAPRLPDDGDEEALLGWL